MWKRKRLIFCGSGSTLMKEVGSESVEKEPEADAIFFKIRRFRIFNLATTVGVKFHNNDNNNIESTTRAWYGIWTMPEWNGMKDFKNEMEDNLPYQFHTRFCALYLQKNTYRCRVVINNTVTEVFNFNIYG